MPYASTNETLVSHIFFNVGFNGVSEFARRVKI
jgi:hypothetical protein